MKQREFFWINERGLDLSYFNPFGYNALDFCQKLASKQPIPKDWSYSLEKGI